MLTRFSTPLVLLCFFLWLFNIHLLLGYSLFCNAYHYVLVAFYIIKGSHTLNTLPYKHLFVYSVRKKELVEKSILTYALFALSFFITFFSCWLFGEFILFTQLCT